MEKNLNWRDEAINESARGFNYENHQQALMVAIRRAEPLWSSVTVTADRTRAAEFFIQHCNHSTSLLEATHTTVLDYRRPKEETATAFWVAVNWQGADFEVAYSLLGYGDVAVCLASPENRAQLSDFAAALREFCARPQGRSLSFANGSWSNSPQIDEEIGRVTWENITLPPDMMCDLRSAVEGFFAHRDALKSLGFAWKRGILLVGLPGTGKTMVCKAVASATPEMPFLYVRDFEGHNAIPNVFERARQLAPCVLAFEDIDGLLDGSNRTVFLNEMDGFASNEGLLVIASSNHPGKIDEALLRRPSRFDRVFHIGLPDLAERRTFCEQLLTRESLADKLSPELDVAKMCDEVAAQTEGFTPAYLKEAFVAAALSRAQEGAAILDEKFAREVASQVKELKAHLKKSKKPDALAEMRSSEDNIGFRR
jgi:hypothetical protein